LSNVQVARKPAESLLADRSDTLQSGQLRSFVCFCSVLEPLTDAANKRGENDRNDDEPTYRPNPESSRA
jgi:hypothetical protein